MFNGHIFAITGSLLIFVAGLFVKSDNPVLFLKIKSVILDGVILVAWLFIVCVTMINENATSISLFSSYEFAALRYKTIGLSIFFVLYYFIREKLGGTFGKRQFGLMSIGIDIKRLSFTESLLKTLFYGIPFFVILIMILSAKMYPLVEINPTKVITETVKFKVFQWLCFLIYLISLIAMFTSRQNKSLSETLSKTLVIESNDVTVDEQNNKENGLN